MPLPVKDIPEAGPDPSIEQDSDAEAGQCLFLSRSHTSYRLPASFIHISLLADDTYDVCVLPAVINCTDVIAKVASSLT